MNYGKVSNLAGMMILEGSRGRGFKRGLDFIEKGERGTL
jgi:hypothetical protein